ncbi:MAG: DNRLRE domain-containing protein, partial [Chloroflexaceae bacterium]|nr:DNRLRE domain-containing protein [Chloroflexaceae bacterium]
MKSLFVVGVLCIGLPIILGLFAGTDLAPPSVEAQELAYELVIDANQDAWIEFFNSSQNYGTDRQLIAGGEFPPTGGDIPNEQRILLGFDFQPSNLPPGAVIVSATLELEQIGSTGGRVVNLQPDAIFAPWEELTVTWSNQPSAFNLGDASVSVTTVNSLKQWDVTSIVQNWSIGEIDNFGIMVRLPQNTQFNGTRIFGSRENLQTTVPRLRIGYTSPVPPTETPTTETPTATVTETA